MTSPTLLEVDPKDLVPGDNIRTDFGDLDALVDSIKSQGVLDAITVRQIIADEMVGETGPVYQVVDGHRRHRAAIKAKVTTVPVIVKDLTDQQVDLAMLITSLQKLNLNPMEEAVGFARLITSKMTPAALAKAVGRTKDTVLARLALLDLPDDVQAGVRAGSVTLAIVEHVQLAVSKGVRDSLMERIIAKAVDGTLTVYDVNAVVMAEGKTRVKEQAEAIAKKGGKALYVRETYDALKEAVIVGPNTRSGVKNVDVDPEAHKSEPCCCFILDLYGSGDKGKVELGCDDWGRHKKGGNSKLKLIDRSKQDPEPAVPAAAPANLDEGERADWEAAEAARVQAENERAAEVARLKAERAAELTRLAAERERRAEIDATRRRAVVDSATAKDATALADAVLLSIALGYTGQRVHALLDVTSDSDVLALHAKGGKQRQRALSAAAVALVAAEFIADADDGYDWQKVLDRSFRDVADKLAEPAPADLEHDAALAADQALLEDLWDRNRATEHAPMLVTDLVSPTGHRCGICALPLTPDTVIPTDEGVHLPEVEADFTVPHLFAPDLEDHEPGDAFYCAGCGQKVDGEMHDLTPSRPDVDGDAVSLGPLDDQVAVEAAAWSDGSPVVDSELDDAELADAMRADDSRDRFTAADRQALAPDTLTDEERDAFDALPDPSAVSDNDASYDVPAALGRDYDGEPAEDEQPAVLAP